MRKQLFTLRLLSSVGVRVSGRKGWNLHDPWDEPKRINRSKGRRVEPRIEGCKGCQGFEGRLGRRSKARVDKEQG